MANRDLLTSHELDSLLLATSRTFAVSIPLLAEPTRRTVGLAYLMFRVADTLEDAESWTRAARAAALDAFVQLVRGERDDVDALTAAWLAAAPSEHAGYVDLVGQLPRLLRSVRALPSAELVCTHTGRCAEGMRDVLLEAQERSGQDEQRVVRLGSLRELRRYCYYVAGIVGELLTDVFVFDTPGLLAELGALRREERLVGEALQLVNILKDEADDAKEDRVFIPAGLAKEELFALARADLAAGTRYLAALERGGAAKGIVAFTGLPLAMAELALQAVEERGAGAKVSRAQVASLLVEFQALSQPAPQS